MPTKERTRTVTWDDPLQSLAKGSELSGLEYIKSIFEARIAPPPIALTMSFAGGEAEEGRALFYGEPGEFLYNPIGVIHGGWAMTLLDSAMGCAVHTTLKSGEAYTTLETKVNFVRPITMDTGRVLCEGVVVHRGGKIATAEGKVTAEATGKLLAHGSSTCLLIRR